MIRLTVLFITVALTGAYAIKIREAPRNVSVTLTQSESSGLSMSCKASTGQLSASEYTVSPHASATIGIDLNVWAMDDREVKRLNDLMITLLKGTFKDHYEKNVHSTKVEGHVSGFMSLFGSGGSSTITTTDISQGFEQAGLSKEDETRVVEAFLQATATKNSIHTTVTVENLKYDYAVSGHFTLFALDCTIKTSSGDHHTRMTSNYPAIQGSSDETLPATTPIDLSGPSSGHPHLAQYEDHEFPENDKLESTLAEIDPNHMPAGFASNHFTTLNDGKSFSWHNKYLEATVSVSGSCLSVKVDWKYMHKFNVINSKKCAPHAKICKSVSRFSLMIDVCAEVNDEGVLLKATFKVFGFSHSFSHQFTISDIMAGDALEATQCNDGAMFPLLTQKQLACVKTATGLENEITPMWELTFPKKYKDLSSEAHMSWLAGNPGQNAHFTCRKNQNQNGHHIRACKGAANKWLRGGCCGGNGWPSNVFDSMARLLKTLEADDCLPQC